MRYPGYLLNPGDMFQVDPERVMFATGQTKQPLEDVEEANEESAEEKEPDADDAELQAKGAETKAAEAEDVDIDRDPRDLLKHLLSQSRAILASPKEGLAAKRKQELRAFATAVKKMLSRSKSSTILTDSLEAQFAELQNQLKIRRQNKGSSRLPEQKIAENETTTSEASASEAGKAVVPEPSRESYANSISDSEYDDLQAALLTMNENPVDDTKPYATPWMPRDYMSAFAFIPRYLEVNQNICAAVYLRHPVVRPGMAEVPSPFGEDVNSVAHTWYLRRR